MRLIDADLMRTQAKTPGDICWVDEQPTVNQWIPVSERLPNDEACLKHDGRFILTDGNRTYQGWFSRYEGYFVREGYKFEKGVFITEDQCVIAWQPLPEPYRDSEVEK